MVLFAAAVLSSRQLKYTHPSAAGKSCLGLAGRRMFFIQKQEGGWSLDLGMPKNWGNNTWVEPTKFPHLKPDTRGLVFSY